MSTESRLKSNSKFFWSYINSKRKTNGYPNCMTYSGSTTSDIPTICNMFATHFKSVYSSVSPSSEDLPNVSELFDLGSLKVDVMEVEKALLLLDCNKKEGPDGIPPLLLRSCASVIAKPLTHIFNMSLSNGHFLDEWKVSFISPIFKSGSKQDVTNYRPICKISTIPKLFEKIIYNKLYFVVKEHISVYQHGFVSGKSTTTNLSILTNFIVTGFEKKVADRYYLYGLCQSL